MKYFSLSLLTSTIVLLHHLTEYKLTRIIMSINGADVIINYLEQIFKKYMKIFFNQEEKTYY